ncbi:zinc finger protein ZAT4-like protein [Tanacetum coccineum]
MSSISNTSPEEDAAFCLMLLSRDTWSDMHDIKSKNSTRIGIMDDNDHKTKIVLSGDIKVHECDVCFKVFGSGQALGGHKRSHVNVGKPKINLIDLNLPTPIDEDTNYNDDDAGSQFEASVRGDDGGGVMVACGGEATGGEGGACGE